MRTKGSGNSALRSSVLLTLGCLIPLAASNAWSQTGSPSVIGVFADPDGASCSIFVDAGQSTTLYVSFVRNNHPTIPGVDAAHVGVNGVPAGWIVQSQPSPAASVSIGTPVATSGAAASIQFPSCQAGDVTVLYEVTLFATTQVEDVLLTVGHLDPGSGSECMPNIGCACGPPCFTPICVEGGQQAIINPTGNGCTVPVASPEWGAVKALFRE